MLSPRGATALVLLTLLAACGDDPVEPPAAEAAPPPAAVSSSLACTKWWAGSGSGKWFVAKNWRPVGVPGATDVACLIATGKFAYTVELNRPTTIAGLEIGGAGLIAPATLLLNSGTAAGTGLEVTTGIIIRAKSVLQFDDSLPFEGLTTSYLVNEGTLALGGLTSTEIVADSVVNLGTITPQPMSPTVGIFQVSGPTGFRNSGTLDGSRPLWIFLGGGSRMVMEGGEVTEDGIVAVFGDTAQPSTFEWQAGSLASSVTPSWTPLVLYGASLELGTTALAGSIGLYPRGPAPITVTGDAGPGVRLSVIGVDTFEVRFESATGGPATMLGTLETYADEPLTLSGPGLVVSGSMLMRRGTYSWGVAALALDSLINEGTLTVEDSAQVSLANGKLLRNRGSLVTPGSGSLLLAGGTLAAEAGSSHTGTVVMQAGRIEGTGSLDTVAALAGAIEPGSPVGALSLTKLTMSPPAGLGLDLAGTAPGSFDQLLVAGQVQLAGTLTVRELSPFVAGVCGQVLPVLLDHSTGPRGAFGKFSGLTPGPGRGFRVHLQPDTVSLVGFNPLPPVSKGPTTLTVAEGGAAGSYSICLQHAPTADVTVTPTSLAGQLQPMTPVTFTPTAWGLPRNVSVAAVDDAIYEPPPQQDDVTHVVSSTDPAYQFAGLANEPVTILDNDGSANLELTILNAAPVVASGNSFTLNLRVGNSGPDISVGSTFSLPASAGYHFVSATGVLGCAADPVTGIRCDLPSVAAGGASFTFDVTLAADAAGSYPTTYTLTSIQPDPAPANNARLQTITVQ